ncbi:FecR family protein [Sphingosinicella rhizophila]|uniref:FecR domain-containing protein n=1 Tax=Sphingosinicella rhizophila TaxID=3050082 RepID=A0ABU3Q928_9SPHN|nr:FecR domain-containing protein [Sphingosinicella sp. GR2756]MDT9599881.1 FecR domain-containing protein [Sphingosinicella sp. GR2756]
MVWPFRSARDRLDDKAAEWASKMRGPERERHRSAFERWYRSSPAHAEAFEEATAGFEEAGVLRQGELGKARHLPEPQRKAVPLRYAFGAVAAAAAVALIFLMSAYAPSPVPSGDSPIRYATAATARNVELSDGSHMVLAPETIAIASFTSSERRITLERGRGRFTVAHEARPFRVAAGEAEVLALGTVFEVSYAPGQTRVALIQGSVDVSYPGEPEESGRQVRRLQPGEQIVVGTPPQGEVRAPPLPRAPRASAPRVEPAPRMLEFDNAPLTQAVVEVNRHSRTRLILADPSIGELRITGGFRAGDVRAFAETLAAAFSLHLERRPDGSVALHAIRADPEDAMGELPDRPLPVQADRR